MITGSFDSQTGDIQVQIMDGQANATVEIVEISPLKYKFDLTPDSIDVNAVQALYNRIKIEIYQFTVDKQDIYDRITSTIFADGKIEVQLTIDDGPPFRFQCALNDVKLREAARTISMNCRVFVDDEVSTLDVFDDIESEEPALLHRVQQTISGSSGVRLTWSFVQNGEVYIIERSTESSSSGYTILDSGLFLQFTDPTPPQNQSTTYWYRIRVLDDGSQQIGQFGPIQIVYESLESCSSGGITSNGLNACRPSGGDELDCAGALDWIEYALKAMFGNDNDTVVVSAPSGLSSAYSDTNYASFREGIRQEVSLLMLRMTSPPFDGFDAGSESQDVLILYTGDFTFEGSGFEDSLNNGDSITLVNTAGQEVGSFIVNEVESDSRFTITAQFVPPAIGWYLWSVNERRRTSALKAIEALKEMAATEGAIFGSGFGRNFYVNRLSEQEIVNIHWNDIIDYDTSPFYSQFGAGVVEQLAQTRIRNGDDIEDNIGVDTFGIWPTSGGGWQLPAITSAAAYLSERPEIDQELNMRLAPGYPFLSKARGFPDLSTFITKYTGTPQDWNLDFEPVIALCKAGLQSYKRSLSGDGRDQVIEFSCFGALSIKPWNLIQFTGPPPKYVGRKYRPTSIEYDFVRDIVTVKAYQVNQVAPPSQFAVSGNSSASGEVQISTNSGAFISVHGTASSDGSISTDDFSGIYLTGKVEGEDCFLTVEIDEVTYRLTGVVPKSVQAEGIATASGEVIAGLLKEVEVAGTATADGAVDAGREILFGDAAGTASSDGSVSTEVFQEVPIQVSGDSTATGDVESELERERDVDGESSSSGSVSTNVIPAPVIVDINVSGAASSDGAIQRVIEGPPNPPSTPSACISGTGQLLISWNSVPNADSYIVEKSVTSSTSGYSDFATTGSTTVPDSEPEQNPNTPYWYRVIAVNSYGESQPSGPLEVVYNSTGNC